MLISSNRAGAQPAMLSKPAGCSLAPFYHPHKEADHMLTIAKREIKNYLKNPLFLIGVILVVLGVWQQLAPYLTTRYLSPEDSIVNDYPETVHSAEPYEGYIPTPETERREIWNRLLRESFIVNFEMSPAEADAVIDTLKNQSIPDACSYLEEHCHYFGADHLYAQTAYRKGTNDEINAYLDDVLKDHPFSFYFSRKFADFAGLFMGFFATIMLSVLFIQDTRKHTYELLHTKPISAGNYVVGKVLGGFAVCLIVLVLLNLVFYAACLICTGENGFVIRLLDFIMASCRYILPNMFIIVCIYALIALLFKNPIPAMPLLFLLIVYSNMGGRNADGVYGYYGRPLAIMVRFPGALFDAAEPPMARLNQCFLLIASACIILFSIRLWRRRRI